MKKKPNFEKVSVSLPPEVHEWIKREAERRTRLYGESWSASRVIQEAMREYRARNTTAPGQAMPDRLKWNETEGNTSAAPHHSAETSNILNPSAGGSSPRRYPTKKAASRRKS